jgi:hypothetical protein
MNWQRKGLYGTHKNLAIVGPMLLHLPSPLVFQTPMDIGAEKNARNNYSIPKKTIKIHTHFLPGDLTLP